MTKPLWSPYWDDGHYKNPILYADYSDPDVIRVGSDYYMVASSFQCAPGLPILHSQDLVGWRVISYVLARIPSPGYDKPAHGKGAWAPSIRYHADRFWVFFPMPDEGIFYCTAHDPKGPWSEPVLLKQAKGWIDPCPLWDDDGKAYLVNAFAKSRCGIKSVLQLVEMAPDASTLLGKSKIIFDGYNTQPTIEGPKLYKRHGWYYIFAPAGGVPNGWQTVLRARNIWGPYEEKIVMMRGDSQVNGPHQGGWVDTPGGEDWFIHFQDKGYCGRIAHLQPMCWKNDWPVIGQEQDDEGWGTPVESWSMPCTGISPTHWAPAASDQFTEPALGLQWQWNANPCPTWYSISPKGLWLADIQEPDKLCDASNLLFQKFPCADFTVTTELDLTTLAPGSVCGLMMLSRAYSALLARRTPEGIALEYRSGHIAEGAETRNCLTTASHCDIQMQMSVDTHGHCLFSCHTQDDFAWVPMGEATAEQGVWTGAKVGLICVGNAQPESGAFVKSFLFG